MAMIFSPRQPRLRPPQNAKYSYPIGLLFNFFASAKIGDMRKLRNDDYLMEVTLRVGIRKEHAQQVLALTEPWPHDETEEDKMVSAAFDLVEQGLDKCELLEYESGTARRIRTLKEFQDMTTLGQRPRLPKVKTPKPELESPLTKKQNKGKKISLDTADRLFAGLKERLNRLSSYEEFGVDVPLVVLFGSYLRREPEVGDIDLSIVTVPNLNHAKRQQELAEAGRFSGGLMAELYAPQKEVLQFIKNRSSWLALHEFSELSMMENLSFKVIHSSPDFQPLVDQLERGELTKEKFFEAAEERCRKISGEIHRTLRARGKRS